MGFFRKLTDWAEEHDPLFRMAKKGAYAVAKQDSDNMEGIGRAIGWDWLTEEAQRNQKNPGRAIGKAAAIAATIYGGGLLGGAGGAGGAAANAATTAGTAGVGPVMSGTAYEAALEAAKQAAAQGAVQSGNATANGLLGFQGELASVGDANAVGGLLGGAPAQSSQIAHNTAFDAIKNANSFGEGMGNLKSWAMNGYKGPSSMSAGDAKMGLMGLQMMGGNEQPMQPAPPPRPSAPPPQSSFTGYGDQPPPGVDPMQWAQLPDEIKRQLMAQRGMR